MADQDSDLYPGPPPPPTPPPVVDTTQLISSIQTELRRLGCTTSAPDGVWGKSSLTALNKFASYAGVNLASDPTEGMLQMLQSHNKRVCPAPVVTPPKPPKKQPTHHTTTTTTPSHCFSFNGTSYCE